ncbi:MAG: sugar phosphate isomerase/epimerase [Clostridiales bacterium]|nr:sugar phosphate isomerase/epimerase [Clostridiales bacterium]
MEYGIQMYSLRDLTDKDLDAALKAVADMGYKKIEFAGFFDHTAEEINAMLNKYDLKLVATHSDWKDLRDKYDETIAYHKAIGNKRYIIPGAKLDTRECLDEFIEFVNSVIPKMRAEGIELGFHNHASEFQPTAEGYLIHSELQERTDLFFELDTYWTFVAGLNPVAELERLGDRVKMIHLKDGTPDGNGLSLGSGEAPVAAVKAKAQELGLDIVVESEGCNPTGIEEVTRCMDYLKTLD